jgi:hypothetical protein
MAGMPMPHCPSPEQCGVRDTTACLMSVVFSASGRTCLFFSAWHIDSDAAQWLLAIVGIWLLAFLREGLTIYRIWAAMVRRQGDGRKKDLLDASSHLSVSSVPLEASPAAAIQGRSTALRQPLVSASGNPSDAHGDDQSSGSSADVVVSPAPPSSFSMLACDSLHYLMSLAFGYLLMLLIMTYNVWVCFLVLAGCAFWHLTLHWCLEHRWKPAHARRSQLGQQRIQERAAPTSGEHCCDDLALDE